MCVQPISGCPSRAPLPTPSWLFVFPKAGEVSFFSFEGCFITVNSSDSAAKHSACVFFEKCFIWKSFPHRGSWDKFNPHCTGFKLSRDIGEAICSYLSFKFKKYDILRKASPHVLMRTRIQKTHACTQWKVRKYRTYLWWQLHRHSNVTTLR